MSDNIYDDEATSKFVFEKLDEISEYLGAKHNIALAIDIGDDQFLPFCTVLDALDGRCREGERVILARCVEQLAADIRECDEWYDDAGERKE